MSRASTYLTKKVCDRIRQEIRAAEGNEVFFVGYVDDDLIVQDVQVVARGHDTAVPVVRSEAEDADVVIHNHPNGVLKPSDADLAIAAQLDDFSTAFFIVDNNVENIYAVLEPRHREETTFLDIKAMEKLLQPGGLIAKNLPSYEDRPQQIDMIEQVIQAFNRGTVATIEAGTGTGKTMAYLLPAIHWAVHNKERVVVSTNTINLQEQLINKDIPFLQKVLDVEFDAVLIKGRSNYVCLRKVDDVQSELILQSDDQDRDELLALIQWAKKTKDGSKADLSFIPKWNVWEKIAAESDTCPRSRCLHFKECFVNRARRQAAKSHILVVNHHLLFADLAVRHQTGSMKSTAVLPPYQSIIFDEAHHIEGVATNYFGSQITRGGVIRILHRLHRRTKETDKGYLHLLRLKALRYREDITDEKAIQIVRFVQEELVPSVDNLIESTDVLMDKFYQVIEASQGVQELKGETKIRLIPQVVNELIHQRALKEPFDEYLHEIHTFTSELAELVNVAKPCTKFVDDPGWDSVLIELNAQMERLNAAHDIIKDVLFNHDDDHIRWIEAKPSWRGRNIVRFKSSPLEVGEMMNMAVYDNFNTIIMTSATLTVDKKFDFLADRIGLDELQNGRRSELLLDAPFDYESQVLLTVPTDMPDPREQQFAQKLSAAIFKALSISKGRAFVLFTSYGLLNMIYRELVESLEKIGIHTLKQGEENRDRLITRFRRDTSSVLFATDSFWEGVDVEGKALESVIITKLPFQVPSEPVIEARYEAIQKRGGNAFMEYAVPLAVLKLKQGFGRLIRRKSDRGSVIIFDKRVIQKSYGKRFINSLPKCRLVTGSRDQIFNELKHFFS